MGIRYFGSFIQSKYLLFESFIQPDRVSLSSSQIDRVSLSSSQPDRVSLSSSQIE